MIPIYAYLDKTAEIPPPDEEWSAQVMSK
jgi:hypothetical protein